MISALRNAFAFLTILPAGYDEHAPPGRSFAFYPVVGLALGIILCLTMLAADRWFSPAITAFLVLLVWAVLTGGLHLDGFGDSCDGLFATVEPERRLEIMKDSRAGSWAVVGLILLLLGKWVALQSARPIALLLPLVMGRWGMVLAAYAFPYARTTGVGAYFRAGLTQWHVLGASGLAILIVVGIGVVVDVRLVAALPATLFLIWGVGSWAARRLGGGLTGDVYGAICELTELVILLLLNVLWHDG